MSYETKFPLLHIQPKNWRSIIYTAVLLAVKYWEDRVYWNNKVVEKLQIFDLKTTNKFENLFIELIDFKLNVKNEVFDEYFRWLAVYKQFKIQSESKRKSSES